MLPLFEGFEGGVPPTDWIHIDGSNFSLAWETDSDAYSGAYSAYHGWDSAETDNDFLVGPLLDLSDCDPGATITLTYWERNELPSWYVGHYVAYTTNPLPVSPSDFALIQEMGPGSSSWAQRTVPLSPLVGFPAVRIAFHYYGYNADSWYVDDVAIEVN